MPSGTLSIAGGGTSFTAGASVTFDYSTATANSANWVGIYQRGQTPGQVASSVWAYAPAASGQVTFSTAALAPGTSYQAWLFYDNGYGEMSAAVAFSVTPAPKVPQPVYHASLDGRGRTALQDPSGVAAGPGGDVWTVDARTDRVVEFGSNGKVMRSFGARGSGRGQLEDPQAIAVARGDVYVADTGNNRVEVFTAAGAFAATIGGPGTGDGQFTAPEGVAVGGNGDIYVSDTGGNRVEVFSHRGTFGKTITAGMSDPQGLTVSGGGDLWVAQNGAYDTSQDAVTEYGPSGAEIATLGRGNNSDYGGMSNPADVAVDGSGNVYVTEPDYDLVQEFGTDGVYEGEFGTPGKGRAGLAGTLSLPESVAAGPGGRVYIADGGNHRIAEFLPPAQTARQAQP